MFGPAYLDRVLRVDRPLFEPSLGPPFDQSIDGDVEVHFDSQGSMSSIPRATRSRSTVPDDWPGPTGEVRLTSIIRAGAAGRRSLRGLDWHDDLGGMGAGYAAALERDAWSAPSGRKTTRRAMAISERLDRAAVSSTTRSEWPIVRPIGRS